MRKDTSRQITIRLPIEVSAPKPFAKSYYKGFSVFEKNYNRKIGDFLDVNCDGTLRFFTSFYEGYIPDNYIVLLNEKAVIESLLNERDVVLDLQISEIVSLSRIPDFSIPKKDKRNPDIILMGELRGNYYLFKEQTSEKWIVSYLGYWGEVIEPKNPYDFWHYK